jgi:hypothetical protein
VRTLFGTPRIHSELLKLGVKISQASVAKYMVRHRRPPSQTWRTFLNNHVSQLASVDFFTIHTVWFEILFVFIVLAHDRRRVVHFNVTAHPTAEWTACRGLVADRYRSLDVRDPGVAGHSRQSDIGVEVRMKIF